MTNIVEIPVDHALNLAANPLETRVSFEPTVAGVWDQLRSQQDVQPWPEWETVRTNHVTVIPLTDRIALPANAVLNPCNQERARF